MTIASRIANLSNEIIAREVAFATAAANPKDERTIEWRDALLAEAAKRASATVDDEPDLDDIRDLDPEEAY